MDTQPHILAVTDLTAQSDAAVRAAATLAVRLEARLHVLHALGLTNRPLRAVMPALHNMRTAVTGAETLIHAQLARVTTANIAANALVDFEDPLRALEKRGRELEAVAVFAPALWQWHAQAREPGWLTAATIRRLPAPLIVQHHDVIGSAARIGVVSHVETIGAHVIEAAGRLANWLLQPQSPHFEVFLLGELSPVTLETRMQDAGLDLIVVDNAVFGTAGAVEVDRLMPRLLQRGAGTLALLPGGARAPSAQHAMEIAR